MTERLPIYDIEADIISVLTRTRRLVLQAPTGSGKSTQTPQMLLKHGLLGNGQVVILQPRRLAARLLAARVAKELNVSLGGEVGYRVRFENATALTTRITFETEGILLRQMIEDRRLEGIQALIFDEFHERHLYGDITLARALDIQEAHRPDLLIIVMSATLDAGTLERYLKPCSVLSSEGRRFPVTVRYLPRRLGDNKPPIWELAADAFSDHAPDDGDVLVFMPGAYEINRTIEAIRRRPKSKGRLLLPLHGELPPQDQDAAVASYDRAKVVVETNVADTSNTIDGVRLVIDSGLARIPRYDANRGINTLLVERISQSSSEQRAGRAGRTSSGECVRLWSEAEQHERPLRDVPEVNRLDLAEIVLSLKAAGVGDLQAFRWIDPPRDAALAAAEELLLDLGAVTRTIASGGERPQTELSELGRRMLAFPIHPRYSRMLLAAQEYGCVYEACLIAAMTQGRDLLVRSAGRDALFERENAIGKEDSSDFWALIRAWQYAARNHFNVDLLRSVGIHAASARQVGPLYEQFVRIAKQQGLKADPISMARDEKDVVLRKCILIGFSDRVARRTAEGALQCDLVHGRRGALARESVVKDSSLVVAGEIREVGRRAGEVNTILSLATAIELEWLQELFPNDMQSDLRVTFDLASRRVRADDVLRFRDLVIRTKAVEPPPPTEAARLLAEEILAGRLDLPRWDHSVDQWIERLHFLSEFCPDLHLPPIRDEDRKHIIEQLCLGAVSYKEVKDRDVKSAVKAWLSDAQIELLEKYAPERIALSNGRTPKVTYRAGAPPFVSLRIQELFDVMQNPRIGMGRAPVSIQILAPNMRPVQITPDLANFWREHYPRIKSELQRKYPKHEWR